MVAIVVADSLCFLEYVSKQVHKKVHKSRSITRGTVLKAANSYFAGNDP